MQRSVDITRVRILNNKSAGMGPVIYWMSRDQRVDDNWALLYAREQAAILKQPLVVVFCLVPKFLGATFQQYSFMLDGLKEFEKRVSSFGIGFVLLSGQPESEIPGFMKKLQAGVLVTDFSPLRLARGWRSRVAKRIDVVGYEVDAHNIVPCWEASDKQEYAAYTIRPKINRLLPEYLVNIPKLEKTPFGGSAFSIKTDWEGLLKSLPVDRAVGFIDTFKTGEVAAGKAMGDFLNDRLPYYANLRNDPTECGQSDLSPYLHFGQLSAQRLAFEVKKRAGNTTAGQDFLEELVIRRELADNFCYYNQSYDTTASFPRWAKETLAEHRSDRREYLYSLKQFETAQTHDDLWNAAQLQMVFSGKMHGYLRMYWAKKILEWSSSPEQAMETAIYLNDRYSLDGRDPNGYAGIAWSIGGVHDRAWPQRPIFGKIRYMSYNGSRSKFNVKKYIEQINVAVQG